MHKQELRKEYINIRNNIKDKEGKSLKIKEYILNSEEYLKARVIALFVGYKSEVNTTPLIEAILKDHKTLVLPRIHSKGIMEFHIITSLNELEVNKMGIKEPLPTCPIIPKQAIDIMYLPGLCFDTLGNRIGYGGGYYDRYLSDIDIKTVGLCFDEQIINNPIISDIHDIKVKAIISDSDYYVMK